MSMYLSFHDPVEYTPKTVDINAKTVLLTDIFRDYKTYFNKIVKNYKLTTYYIQGSPRPEYLSYLIYGNTQLYWVLLMCNNVYDPFHGWIKSQQACYESARQQYNSPDDEVVYHVDGKGEKYYNLIEYPDERGVWYDKGDVNKQYIQYRGTLIPITANESAILENEELRQIKIIQPSDIDNFISDFIRELENNE